MKFELKWFKIGNSLRLGNINEKNRSEQRDNVFGVRNTLFLKQCFKFLKRKEKERREKKQGREEERQEKEPIREEPNFCAFFPSGTW